MENRQIRDVASVTVLPPREGFSPGAIGAVGMMVRLLASAEDIVVGQAAGDGAFASPRLVPVQPRFWCARGPVWGRTDRYMEGAVRAVRGLRAGPDPSLGQRPVEVHNRANLALKIAQALPEARVTLFLHNDPQGMRAAKTPAERQALLGRMRVVCVSHHVRDRFMAGLTGAAATPIVLHNAIDLEALPPSLPQAARDKRFLFAGRVVADKGVDAFIRAFAAIRHRLPGWEATIIGADRFRPGSPETPFMRGIFPGAQAAGIAMPGYRPHEDILAAMARAAIVVVPSRWQEPFGLTALEAMASGAALVCARSGGLPEVAGDAALYAPPDPPGQLEAAMLALASNQTQREALAQAGLARAGTFNAPAARARLQALRRG